MAAHLSEENLSLLNRYLADHSYIEGFEASQADLAIIEAISCEQACCSKYPHIARWCKHIKALQAASIAFPGTKKTLADYSTTIFATCAAKAETKAEEDIDLFGSDEEDDEEEAKAKAQRLAEYQAKKAKKPAVIAKSSVVLDVKPWDDTTDMAELERQVRLIQYDGLLWGASKLVPIGYGIQKLQISCVVEDDKVGTDLLEEAITGIEELVQSMDVFSFNKI